jgi:hypothetical protein
MKDDQKSKTSDCLSCRLTGVAVCLSAAATLAWQSRNVPPAALSNPSARVAMLAGACLFGGLAAVRAVV